MNYVWRKFWREVNTPDDFAADPYGWTTNQMAHTLIGGVIAAVLVVISRWWFDEYPHKEAAALACVLPYLLNELVNQRWRGIDTLADTFFFAIGGYMVLSSLTEVWVNGFPYLKDNWQGLAGCLVAWAAVWFIGVRKRIERKYGAS